MYFDGEPFQYLGIAFILLGGLYYGKQYTTSNEDPRIAILANTGKYSCKEEIERYLYYQDCSQMR